MSATSLSILAILLYFITWVLITRCVRASINENANKNSHNKPDNHTAFTLIWLLALLVHIIALHFPLFIGEPLTLNIFSLGSYVMWFINLALFITTLKRKLQSLAIIILPLTIISILIPVLLGSTTGNVIRMKSGLGLHILTSLLAYSFLMLASFQALLLSFQNNRLHTHNTNGFIRSLPSLEDMEHLLFRFIWIGVVLLSIGLAIGFYYLDNMFAQHIAHKTILSIIAWCIFSALLYGRWRYGWRGKKAVRWTLTGFFILMLAFFGTKFIQQFIL